MKIHFLSAKLPLTKTFTRLPSGAIDKSAYPLVKNFTSHDEEIHTPEDFCAAVTAHAARGHSLLKGKLNRALSQESRAGSTNPLDPTRWSCFDLDNVKGVTTVEAFIANILPSQFHDVDYVLQYSASAGIIPDEGLRAHVFFLHDREFTPEAAKLWLTEVNLKNTALVAQVELTAAGTALRFPLDRTVCQNDKLIYIAPPALGDGVEDRYGDGTRIQLVNKSRRYVDFNWGTQNPPAGVEALVQAKVTTLRKNLGLKPKTGTTRQMKNGELLLKNPDTAVVTGEKKGRGFVYLNINGGDSWGYYYSEENPKYLRNFKGEPVVVLADFLPTYWSQIAGTIKKERKGDRPFAFRNIRNNTIWNGIYDPINHRIKELAETTRMNLPDFFANYDLEAPEPLQDWTFEFNPEDLRLVDFEGKYCNRFHPTQFMRDAQPASEIPRTINRVLKSVTGDDEESYHHFLNWLAMIFQTRRKLGTAWVFHGVQGTGKGVLYHNVLVPLFGARHCVTQTISGLEEHFNAELEECLIFNVDEARIDDSRSTARIVNKLKNMISEPTLSIRAMHKNKMQLRSFVNFIFTSNDYDALAIAADDRRFNVAPRQETPIVLTPGDMEAIETELTQFAGFLAGYAVDMKMARTALNNDAKRAMREAGQDAVEQMCQAVTDGNLEYFMSYLDTEANSHSIMHRSNYRSVMRRWLDQANQSSIVTNADILTAYVFLNAPPTAPGPQKFGRMLVHKNLRATGHRPPGGVKTVWGHKVVWKATPEQDEEWREMLTDKPERRSDIHSNVVPWTPSKAVSA